MRGLSADEKRVYHGELGIRDQLHSMPMGTSSPVRSTPSKPAIAEARALVGDSTYTQHWGEVGDVTGGGVPVGMAAARVWNHLK
jgi:hypothetical protein